MDRHRLFFPYLALASVCLFWGTTYLGIRMALETFPPLVLVSVRYIISGGIMLLYALARGIYVPRGRELRSACISGFFCLSVGNGALVFAETMIPSGMAGLITTISPFWLVSWEALLPGGARLHAPTIGGMLVGLMGASLLFRPEAGSAGFNHVFIQGFFILQLGMAGWSFGSIYQTRQEGKAHPVVAGAVQQLAAGLILGPFALLAPPHAIHWSVRGVGALIYLVIFGSIVGYSSYVYALDRLPVAIVSIYPYANSVVAVFLGWLVYSEPFGAREMVAMAIIFAAVALVKRYSRHPAQTETA